MRKNVPALRLVTAADTAPALPGMPAELLATLGDTPRRRGRDYSR